MLAFDPTRLTFSESDHRYQWGGADVPYSVTGVIGKCGLYKGAGFFTEAGRDRGSAVHAAIELALRYGDLDDTGEWAREFPDELQRVRNVLTFIEQLGLKVIPELIEVPLYSPRGFCGKLDGAFERGAERVLCDWKTGATQPATRLQLAAYASCFKEPRRWRRIPVHAGEGHAKVAAEYPVTDYPRDIADFLACLRCCQLRREFRTEER